jgi:N-acetylmuramoyl-L-alanine amidase
MHRNLLSPSCLYGRFAYRAKIQFTAILNSHWRVFVIAISLIGACQPERQDQDAIDRPKRRDIASQNASRLGSEPLFIERPRVRTEGRTNKLKRIDTYGSLSHSDPQADSDQTVRVVLLLEREAAYRRSELAPTDRLDRRIIVDLESVRLHESLTRTVVVAKSALRRIRAFHLDESIARVSFDVDDATACRIFHLTHPYRVVMDFYVAEQRTRIDRRVGRYRTIVLDPGHGGEQPGARGPNGLKESVLTLDLAERIFRGLRRAIPNYRIVMTRDRDRDMSLEERTAIANGYAADLFVSIHFNASHSSSDKGGVSTFVLDTTGDRQALKLAALENGVSEREVSRLQKVLASLCRADQVNQSLKLAEFIHRETLRSGRKMLPNLVDRGIRRALFFVLVGARMPAVLLEASFLTRPEEAAALQTDRYRQLLADGAVRGIVRFTQLKLR